MSLDALDKYGFQDSSPLSGLLGLNLQEQAEAKVWNLEPGFEAYKALYIHVPFCHRRCAYCDFVTEACSPDDPCLDTYLEQLEQDIRQASAFGLLKDIKTIYLGGGTPSYLGLHRLTRLLYTLNLCMRVEPDIEFTMEANPDSLTEAMVKDVYALGVTRLSLGVQSFNDKELTMLGRLHSSEEALRALEYARSRFQHISLDLMCGLPNQSLESFDRSLCLALSTGIDHLSVYPLTLEEGTPLDCLVEKGVYPSPNDDLAAEMMQLAEKRCASAGFYRYEVASYAKPGGESRHNQAYWTGLPYLGLGPGAVGMKQDANCRVRYDQNGIIETIDAHQKIAEDLMLGMRRSIGVSADEVINACFELPEAWEVFDSLVEDAYALYSESRFKPTKKGWLLGNQMYGRILDLAP